MKNRAIQDDIIRDLKLLEPQALRRLASRHPVFASIIAAELARREPPAMRPRLAA